MTLWSFVIGLVMVAGGYALENIGRYDHKPRLMDAGSVIGDAGCILIIWYSIYLIFFC